MKTILAGSRDFKDYELLRKVCKEEYITEIVSGTAKGADLLGEQFATEFEIAVKRFPAEWNKYGKGAGHKRNAQMAEYADALIAFWDGNSKGTKNMIELAKMKGLKIRIVTFNELE
jgi:hypothetical protein